MRSLVKFAVAALVLAIGLWAAERLAVALVGGWSNLRDAAMLALVMAAGGLVYGGCDRGLVRLTMACVAPPHAAR